jgi:putative chitinase
MILTLHQVAAACGARIDRAQVFLPYIQEAIDAFDINTPARVAPFLAQIGHESYGLKYTTELWGPTPAQLAYEGRLDLGNTQPGDGSRFRAHGLIGTTGRANHAAARDRLRARFPHLVVPDFEEHPEKLAEHRWAALSAGDFWDMKGLNALADAGDFLKLSVRINGRNRKTGLPNGWEDRQARFERAQQVLA